MAFDPRLFQSPLAVLAGVQLLLRRNSELEPSSRDPMMLYNWHV